MRGEVDINTSGLVGYEGLAIAVMWQAVADWRYLCDHGTKTAHRNFNELEQFFKRECGVYLSQLDTTAEEIWEQMRKERVQAGL